METKTLSVFSTVKMFLDVSENLYQLLFSLSNISTVNSTFIVDDDVTSFVSYFVNSDNCVPCSLRSDFSLLSRLSISVDENMFFSC